MNRNDLIQGRYRLDHLLGRGGMAEVWCARDERLERPVAIKFLAAQFHNDPEFLVRFFSEAQLVARISHPNVISILDFGELEERPYLVMEYVNGGTVHELTGRPLLPERAAEIVSQAAWGAGAAHVAGMVHRDIKPGNILLTENGDAKLADFGIASTNSGEQLTATGQAVGSPHYVSPEQASGRACTPRSDVYSLGVVLYELLTGSPPFDAGNVTAIAIAHVEKPPVPPSRHVPDLDPDLEAIVLRCLDKDPDQRFEDGRALGAALEEPASAAAFLPPEVVDEDDYLDYEPASAGRRVVALVLAALVISLLAAAVVAGGRDDGGPSEMSQDLETENQGKRNRRRPSPSPTAAATTVSGSTAPAPSPSPTKEKNEENEEIDEPKTRSGGDTSGGDDTDPTPAPTTEPSPEPTTEPTTEPTPEPAASAE